MINAKFIGSDNFLETGNEYRIELKRFKSRPRGALEIEVRGTTNTLTFRTVYAYKNVEDFFDNWVFTEYSS